MSRPSQLPHGTSRLPARGAGDPMHAGLPSTFRRAIGRDGSFDESRDPRGLVARHSEEALRRIGTLFVQRSPKRVALARCSKLLVLRPKKGHRDCLYLGCPSVQAPRIGVAGTAARSALEHPGSVVIPSCPRLHESKPAPRTSPEEPRVSEKRFRRLCVLRRLAERRGCRVATSDRLGDSRAAAEGSTIHNPSADRARSPEQHRAAIRLREKNDSRPAFWEERGADCAEAQPADRTSVSLQTWRFRFTGTRLLG